jgi:hypothetical protein
LSNTMLCHRDDTLTNDDERIFNLGDQSAEESRNEGQTDRLPSSLLFSPFLSLPFLSLLLTISSSHTTDQKRSTNFRLALFKNNSK